MADYVAYIDGASSGNPGDAGVGIVVYKNDSEILRESKYIGKETNNVAEYTALLILLTMMKKHKVKEIDVFTDSELLVKQLKGEYKIKNDRLKEFIEKIQKCREFIKFKVEHVGRDNNSEADKLAKAASKRGEEIK